MAMNNTQTITLAGLLTMATLTTTAVAQDDRPRPQAPTPQAQPADLVIPSLVKPASEFARTGDQPAPRQDAVTSTSKRDMTNELIAFNMKDVEVEELLKWIKDVTGKIVIPLNTPTYTNRKITVMNDHDLPKQEALDMAFEALRLNDIGIIVRPEFIIVDTIANMNRYARTPIFGPEVDINTFPETGLLVFKVFQIDEVPADELGETLEEHIPDNATLTVDPNSNKLIVHGDIGLAQQLSHIIDELDKNFVQVELRIFNLKYADAQEVADNITELFETDGQVGGTPRAPRRTVRSRQPQQPSQPGEIGPQVEMRLTVNVPTNSVTVVGDPKTVKQIDQLVNEAWDVPRPVTSTKMYVLEHTDPLRMRDILQDLLGAGGGTSGGRGPQGRGAAQGGGQASVSQIVSGIYSIDAIEDKNALVVISKTTQALDFLDDLILKIDQPSDVSLPLKYALKHANAIQLSEELNALLAAPGTTVSLDKPLEGLTMQGIESQAPGGGGGGGGGATPAGGGGRIQVPWAAGGRADQEQSLPSSLIGKVRIMPIIRENALAVLAPPAERFAVLDMIKEYDRPGRQVMIEAKIIEVELTNDLAYGVRFSREGIPLTNIDNSLGASIAGTGSETDPFDIFDTSTFDVQFDANIALQALSQISRVKVLQTPRVFTADNQEARFFEGQQIPFNTGTTVGTGGNTVTQNDFRDVGVVLNVRPRITVEGDLDLEINVELSSVVPGVIISGAPVIDKAEAITQVIIKNNQTIVIGGIFRDRESRITRKIPLLGDVPVLGELFTSRETNTTSSEMLVFITPRVVDTPTEAYELNQPDMDNLEYQLTEPLTDIDGESWRDERRRRLIPPLGQRPMEGDYSAEPVAARTAAFPMHVDPDAQPTETSGPAVVELIDVDDLN